MKCLVLMNLLFLLSFSTFAQDEICVQNAPLFLAMVDTAPIIGKCDNLKDTKDCFKETLKNFVYKQMRTSENGKIERKAYVFFTITKRGEIEGIEVKANRKEQQEEIIKIIKLLEIKSPALIQGQKVAINHFLLIE